MQSERWLKLRRVFESAVELAPDEQSDFLDVECAGNHELRREVEELLAADANQDEHMRFLEERGPGPDS